MKKIVFSFLLIFAIYLIFGGKDIYAAQLDAVVNVYQELVDGTKIPIAGGEVIRWGDVSEEYGISTTDASGSTGLIVLDQCQGRHGLRYDPEATGLPQGGKWETRFRFGTADSNHYAQFRSESNLAPRATVGDFSTIGGSGGRIYGVSDAAWHSSWEESGGSDIDPDDDGRWLMFMQVDANIGTTFYLEYIYHVPPQPVTVAGTIKNSFNGQNITSSSIAVEIFSPTIGTQTVYTTGGRFQSNVGIPYGAAYAVQLPGNKANPQTAPPSYIPPGRTDKQKWWGTCNPPLIIGSSGASYECQVAGDRVLDNNCAGSGGQCNFLYDPCKTVLAPAKMNYSCSADGYTATLNWSPVINAQYYSLRVDHNPDSWPWPNLTDPKDIATDTNNLSYSIPTPDNSTYKAWVHARNNCGQYGGAASVTFSCPKTSPQGYIDGQRINAKDKGMATVVLRDSGDLQVGGTYPLSNHTSTYIAGNLNPGSTYTVYITPPVAPPNSIDSYYQVCSNADCSTVSGYPKVCDSNNNDASECFIKGKSVTVKVPTTGDKRVNVDWHFFPKQSFSQKVIVSFGSDAVGPPVAPSGTSGLRTEDKGKNFNNSIDVAAQVYVLTKDFNDLGSMGIAFVDGSISGGTHPLYGIDCTNIATQPWITNLTLPELTRDVKDAKGFILLFMQKADLTPSELQALESLDDTSAAFDQQATSFYVFAYNGATLKWEWSGPVDILDPNFPTAIIGAPSKGIEVRGLYTTWTGGAGLRYIEANIHFYKADAKAKKWKAVTFANNSRGNAESRLNKVDVCGNLGL